MKKLLLLTILTLSTLSIARLLPDTSEAYKSYYSEFLKWECTYLAIVFVESKNNPNAIGAKGDGGIIQILPKGRGGYLDEANRLLKEDRFADKDRFCPVKSRQIWEVVMKYRNPEKSLKKAIKLHNPGAGRWYAERVIRKYNEYTKNIK